MHNHSDFFGDVFEDPDDDPLLGGDEDGSSGGVSSDSDQEGPPSWVSEEQRNGQATGTDSGGDDGPQRKQIVLDHESNSTSELDAINQAVGQGWRLVRISLTRPEGEQVVPTKAAHRIVATLEKENPQSLFDFGGGA